MSRTKKEKLETYTDASLQLVTENSTEERAIIAVEGCNLDVTLEKRKKDANKPLYLKRE